MILFLPVKPLATRRADMTASVPELTILTISMEGTSPHISSAISTSAGQLAPKLKPRPAASMAASRIAGWLWPRIMGPQEPI